MELKVRKFGKWLDAMLPKKVISRLGRSDGAPLHQVKAQEGGDRLVPYDPTFEAKMGKASDIIGRYRNTLRVLAQ